MSNARIVDRLNGLADAIERGSLSVVELRDGLLGHTEAVEGVPYPMLKEAQFVWAQLSNAMEKGEESSIDLRLVADWLRNWGARVPRSSA